MKRLISFVAAVLATTATANAAIFVDNQQLSVNYVIQQSRTLIPVRGVFEKIGYTVDYDAETKVATLDKDGNHISITTYGQGFDYNGKRIICDVPQQVINDRLFLPLRAIVELTPQYDIRWDAETKNIYITHINAAQESSNANSAQSDTSVMEKQVLAYVNEYRVQNGLKPFEWSDELGDVARAHSKDMADNNFFSHTNLSGQTPFDRMDKAGIKYTAAAENIAAGKKDAKSVVESWINSDGHRANILNPELNKLGVGCYVNNNSKYGIYWTQSFTD